MSFWKWSKTADTNATADATINFQEGQAPRTLNNSTRALMAALAKYRDDISGKLVTGGTSTAYTLTTNQNLTTLTDGFMVRARMHATSGTDPTLDVDSRGAKYIVCDVDGTKVPIGGLLAKRIYTFTYDSSADAWIVEGVDAQLRVGMMADFAGSTVPPLWLLCAGQAVSRTTYATLFAVIGTTYGAGDGSTTFNLPDSRGRVSAGKDNMGGTSANRLTGQSGGLDGNNLGATGGAETHTLTESQMPQHSHDAGSLTTAQAGNHSHTTVFSSSSDTTTGGGGARVTGIGVGGLSAATNTTGAHNHTISGSTASKGSGSAHNNVQPTIVFNKMIYAGA